MTAMMRRSFFALELLLVPILVRPDPLMDDIVDWVRSEGGFFNDSIVEIRRVFDNNTNSYYGGVFAKQDIDAHERLFDVPHSCYIALWDEEEEASGKESEGPRYYDNVCRLAEKLMHEMKLDKDSNYAPYVRFLKTQKHGQLPATWSKAGKDVLRKMLTPKSDVVDFIDWHYGKNCVQGNVEKEHAVAMTVQRGYDTALIPIWDMVNHHNGLINTEHNPLHENGKDGMLRVRSSKTIRKGEEIYATYDLCVDCGDSASYWGTAENLRDFGFVEEYPQRWIFLDHDIYFEIFLDHEEIDESQEFELEIWWELESEHPGQDVFGLPDKDGVLFLHQHLKKLEGMRDSDLKDRGSVPKNEWDILTQFFDAKTVAIKAALDSLEEHDNEL